MLVVDAKQSKSLVKAQRWNAHGPNIKTTAGVDGVTGIFPGAATNEVTPLPRAKCISWLVCWMINGPVTSVCISGTDLLRQFDVLPH